MRHIRDFNNKVVVVKYGGSAMLDKKLEESMMKDVALLKLIGMQPVIVHGGGKEISKWVQLSGKEAKFVEGFRVTDGETMEIAEMVLNKVNKHLVAMIEGLGVKAAGISGKDGATIKVDKKIVNADEQKVSYEVFDAIGIDSIDVYYYDGNGTRVDHIRSTDKGSTDVTDILSDLTDYTGSFTIGSSTTSEPVRIVIKDLAGNVTDTDSKDFDVDSIDFNRAITVSTNFFVRWFANKIVFGCSIAAIIAVGGGLAFFIAIRKRRIDEAITEEIKKKARGSKD